MNAPARKNQIISSKGTFNIIIPERFSMNQAEFTHPGVINSGIIKKRNEVTIKIKPDAIESKIKSFLLNQIIKVGIVKAIIEE